MIVLGVDPGATTGVAVLDVALGRVGLVLKETLRSTASVIQLVSDTPDVDVVAVERVQGWAFGDFAFAKTRNLLEAAELAGICLGIASQRGIETIGLTANEWRRAVVGKPNATDREIKAHMAMVLPDMGRSNAHTRDAIGVALAGAQLSVHRERQ